MKDIAKILQTVQIVYQEMAKKEKKISTWKEDIGKKITDMTTQKGLFDKIVKDKETVSKPEHKLILGYMRAKMWFIDKLKDVTMMTSFLKERIVNTKKIETYELRKHLE